jgi:hypothetical protein
MEVSTSQEYLTSDLGLASFLIVSEIELRNINRTNPRRAIFVFDTPKGGLIAGWQSGRGQVSALAYYSALQKLKGELWRAK